MNDLNDTVSSEEISEHNLPFPGALINHNNNDYLKIINQNDEIAPDHLRIAENI